MDFLNPASVSWAILELKHSSGGLTGSSQLVDGFYKILGVIPLGPALDPTLPTLPRRFFFFFFFFTKVERN